MSMVNTAIHKQPFKLIEIPLNKFHNEAIPHHQTAFETHKSTVQKHISTSNMVQLQREVKDKKRMIRQLRDLMYELDTLRTQVEDIDLGKFDSNTLSLRKIIIELISKYADLSNQALNYIEIQKQDNAGSNKNQDPIYGTSQIQIQDDLSDLKLQEKEKRLQQVEALNQDIEDVHGIFVELNQMVCEQKENINVVEANLEVANENVQSGLRHLIQASRLKKASYPVAGALIGTIVGGPIGSVAGLKIGGIAAIGCGLVGYISGKFIKKVNAEEVSNTGVELNIPSNNTTPVVAVNDKKDI